jgi:hypothetical protein
MPMSAPLSESQYFVHNGLGLKCRKQVKGFQSGLNTYGSERVGWVEVVMEEDATEKLQLVVHTGAVRRRENKGRGRGADAG